MDSTNWTLSSSGKLEEKEEKKKLLTKSLKIIVINVLIINSINDVIEKNG